MMMNVETAKKRCIEAMRNYRIYKMSADYSLYLNIYKQLSFNDKYDVDEALHGKTIAERIKAMNAVIDN